MLAHKRSDELDAQIEVPPYAIAIPVLNGGEVWRRAAVAIAEAKPGPVRVLVVDSGSSDGSAEVARDAGFELIRIPRAHFDHGGTRQMAVEHLSDVSVVAFLTQDAVPQAPDSITTLIRSFRDPRVGVAYGRQLPRPQARPVEAHARLFNYPERGYLRSASDIPRYGIKAAFNSNSFAAYRLEALRSVRGFPRRVIMGEDMCAAARMLLAGWHAAYVPEARVIHSHDYSIAQEFRRYFDIGAFHASEGWLLEALGKPEGEGLQFVRSEMTYLMQHSPPTIAQAVLRTFVKYTGYAMGKRAARLPTRLRKSLSMHDRFWSQKSAREPV